MEDVLLDLVQRARLAGAGLGVHAETKRLKARLLALFARWMNERDFRDTTLQTLLDYCAYLNAKRRADGVRTTVTYRSRQFRVVVNFCAFLHERGKLFVDPGADFPVLHKPQCLPRRVLTHAQRLRLLGQPNTQTALGYRDRAVLEILYSCGLRSLELCKLNVYDLELYNFVSGQVGRNARPSGQASG